MNKVVYTNEFLISSDGTNKLYAWQQAIFPLTTFATQCFKSQKPVSPRYRHQHPYPSKRNVKLTLLLGGRNRYVSSTFLDEHFVNEFYYQKLIYNIYRQTAYTYIYYHLENVQKSCSALLRSQFRRYENRMSSRIASAFRELRTTSEAESARGDGAAQSFDSRPARLIIKNGDC